MVGRAGTVDRKVVAGEVLGAGFVEGVADGFGAAGAATVGGAADVDGEEIATDPVGAGLQAARPAVNDTTVSTGRSRREGFTDPQTAAAPAA